MNQETDEKKPTPALLSQGLVFGLLFGCALIGRENGDIANSVHGAEVVSGYCRD